MEEEHETRNERKRTVYKGKDSVHNKKEIFKDWTNNRSGDSMLKKRAGENHKESQMGRKK